MLVATIVQLLNELAIDLEVSGSCPVGCFFPIPSSFFTKSEECVDPTIFLFFRGHCTRKRTFWRGQEQYSPKGKLFTIGDIIHHRGHYSP